MPHAPTVDGHVVIRRADLALVVALAHAPDGTPAREGHMLVKATLGGRPLTPKQAFTLITLQMMLTGHSKLHATANWGLAESDHEGKGTQEKVSNLT